MYDPRQADQGCAVKFYKVEYDDGAKHFEMEFREPARVPQCGDVYRLTFPISTLAKVSYKAGDLFTVLERTGFAPHHRTSSLGNLLIKCKHMTSVWTEFDHGVATGMFKLVEPPPS